jgi:hypothetical protein
MRRDSFAALLVATVAAFTASLSTGCQTDDGAGPDSGRDGATSDAPPAADAGATDAPSAHEAAVAETGALDGAGEASPGDGASPRDGGGDATASGDGAAGEVDAEPGDSGAAHGGDDAGGGGAVINACPSCADPNDVCCVTMVNGQPAGACSLPGACGGSIITCGSVPECDAGQVCCGIGATPTSPPSTRCASSCTQNEVLACEPGAPICPAGLVCQPLPGTSDNFFSYCAPPSDGGV